MKKLLFICCVTVIAFSSFMPLDYAMAQTTILNTPSQSYDIVIVGAGLSGVSAAISAARLGMKVLIVEDTEVVGGQAVASAVSTMDDMQVTRHGIYLDFLNRAIDHYKKTQTPTNICLWADTTFGFEPKIIDKTLREMMESIGGITLLLNAKVVSAKVKDNTVTSIDILHNGKQSRVTAKMFIDATEYGDFIPLTGARYRVGNGIFPNVSEKAIVQDITYVAVVKKYGANMPKELFMTTKPPHYDEYVSEFRNMVTKDGSFWPDGAFPFNPDTQAAYRALPNEEDANRGKVDGENNATWKYISRTCLNWANDWPGGKKGGHTSTIDSETLSLSTKFLTDLQYRKDISRKALVKTLCLIYYMQHELGLEDWAVDNTQNFGANTSCDLENWSDLPAEFLPIVKFFPPKPYVRESKRLVGRYTMSSKDVRRDEKLKRTLSSNTEAIALGEYPADIHGKWNPLHHEAELLDDPKDLVKPSVWEARLFQVPMGALIPEKINGLLAVEKNISASRLVNGATRLHPIVFHTGEAAGILASMAIKLNVPARRVPAIFVQSKLLENSSNISIWRLQDVLVSQPYYKEISIALVNNIMSPISEELFCPKESVTWQEFCKTVSSVAKIKINLTDEQKNSVLTKQDANKLLLEQSGSQSILKLIQPLSNTQEVVLRQDLACLVYNLLLKQAEINSGLTYPKD
ncbi:MAG: FAD-dependent oxidoreductase [Synergistaceae bacterium]|nr:FAD-dependent oxidoreductase [Synergistaceae bacterium]